MFHSRRCGFQNEAEAGSLCLFCQHLDLVHLFGFIRNAPTKVESVRIALGTLAEVEARRECVFCHIVMCTIRAHTVAYQAMGEPIAGDRRITIDMQYTEYFEVNLSVDDSFRSRIFAKKALPQHLESIHEANQVVGNWISWKPVRRVIDLCSTEHTGCLPTGTTPSGMRLIDVQDRRVTPELNPHDRRAFVALSYVWGKNIDSRRCVLLKENTTQLEQVNGLENLPKAIEDAITICENLGHSFLWVDRLCIVQDDEEKKNHQIHAMADIFQSAVLTIVAACGDSMESSIPGVNTERQTFQSQVHIGDLQIRSALPLLSQTLPGASWSKRGWTYQESVLSSRKLYFTDLEVWFACNDGFRCEDVTHKDIDPENPRGNSITMSQQLHRYPDLPWESDRVMDDYWRHLEEYTKRSLTYQSDIYNGFMGILTAMFGEEHKTIYGLPELCLDRALLWRLGEGTSAWHIRDFTMAKQHLLCPSWAWASIDGAVRSGEDHEFGWETVSLVLWSLMNEDGNLKTVDVEFQVFDYTHSDSFAALVFAWSGGCFEAPLPRDLQENQKRELDYFSLRKWATEDLPQRWPTLKEFWDEVRSQGGFDTQVPLTTVNHLRPGMLLTRTQTAVLGLGARQKIKSFEYFEILNEKGDMIGGVEANELYLKSTAEEKHRLKTTNFELMAVSVSEAPYELRSNGEVNGVKHFIDRNGWVVLNSVVKVLLISWGENALVARRISIGWVHLKAWIETERTWKTVVLA